MSCLPRSSKSENPGKTVNNAIVETLGSTSHVVLATHVRPDGDALGSLLGLADILRHSGKEVLCYLEESVPELYAFLPGKDLIETDFEQVLSFARSNGDDIMGVCLDCGDLQRLGKNGPALVKISPFAVIDHHQNNGGFGDMAWVESYRSSTGEMIYDLARELGVALSREAAECLYTAIVTDTGSFQYDCTSAHTFAVAGKLVGCGVQPAQIAQNIYDQASFGRIQLLQKVLATLETFCDSQVAVIRVSQAMLQETGTTLDDCEGFINHPRSVTGVKVAVFLKETCVDDKQISVSLRAKGACDVARVAACFHGGGHRNAAGFRMTGKSFDQVRDRVLSALVDRISS